MLGLFCKRGGIMSVLGMLGGDGNVSAPDNLGAVGRRVREQLRGLTASNYEDYCRVQRLAPTSARQAYYVFLAAQLLIAEPELCRALGINPEDLEGAVIG